MLILVGLGQVKCTMAILGSIASKCHRSALLLKKMVCTVLKKILFDMYYLSGEGIGGMSKY